MDFCNDLSLLRGTSLKSGDELWELHSSMGIDNYLEGSYNFDCSRDVALLCPLG